MIQGDLCWKCFLFTSEAEASIVNACVQAYRKKSIGVSIVVYEEFFPNSIIQERWRKALRINRVVIEADVKFSGNFS